MEHPNKTYQTTANRNEVSRSRFRRTPLTLESDSIFVAFNQKSIFRGERRGSAGSPPIPQTLSYLVVSIELAELLVQAFTSSRRNWFRTFLREISKCDIYFY